MDYGQNNFAVAPFNGMQNQGSIMTFVHIYKEPDASVKFS